MCGNSREIQAGQQVCELGEKIPPNFFIVFMCLRMVSALRPLAMSILAICCEYHTSDISRAALLQRPVFFLPAFMQGLRLQLACFAPGIAGGVAAVRRSRSIHQLPDCFAVYGNSAFVPKRTNSANGTAFFPATSSNAPFALQAQHLAALLARHKAKLPQSGTRLPLASAAVPGFAQ